MYRDCFPFYAKICVESEPFFRIWEGIPYKHKNKIVFERRYLGYLVYFTVIFFVKNLKPKRN
jgi:hypothetical protein